MYCKFCGNKLVKGAKFCNNCGNNSSDVAVTGVQTKRIVCQDCGGDLEFDISKSLVCCPFCGSKEIVLESDDVKIERTKAEKESIINRQNNEYALELERLKIEAEERNKKRAMILVLISFVMMIILLMMIRFIL